MEIKNKAFAGTLESNDIYIQVEPAQGINIELRSTVQEQFGDDIRDVILSTLNELNVKNVFLKAEDKGAIDYTIIARVKAAIQRGTK